MKRDDSPLAPVAQSPEGSRLRPLAASEHAAMERLFFQVFGELPPQAWYEWKYGAQGLAGRAVGLWDETGRLVAHYAGFPRCLLWQGTPVPAMQIGDVMVAQEKRGLLTRKGHFFRVCSAFFDQWVGAGRPAALAYGFPNTRALRLGLALGLYRAAGEISLLSWPAAPARPSRLWRYEEISAASPRFDTWAERAWRSMATDFRDRVLGQRDPAYLVARYCRRPGVQHHCVALRPLLWGGSPAIVIWREVSGRVRWLDFVGARGALPSAVAYLRHIAYLRGYQGVETWASRRAREDLAMTNFRDEGIAAHFALAQVSACPDDTLAERGWWLAGDTDFL